LAPQALVAGRLFFVSVDVAGARSVARQMHSVGRTDARNGF